MFDCTHYFFLLVLLVLLNNNLRVKSCYSVTSVIYTHFFSSVSDWWNQFPLTAQQSFRALVALVAQSSFLSWKRQPADHYEYSYDMSELTCDVVLTSASDSFSEKKASLPLHYSRWKLTANEGKRKREDFCNTTNGNWLQAKGKERIQVQGITLHFTNRCILVLMFLSLGL